MARLDNTTFCFTCKQYKSEEINYFEGKNIVTFTSDRKPWNVSCPICKGSVIGHGIKTVKLRDIPLLPGAPITFEVHQHRYLCKRCNHTFLEDNPLRAPGLNMTRRCVLWIFKMLQMKISDSSYFCGFMKRFWRLKGN